MKHLLLLSGMIGSLLLMTACQSTERTEAATAYQDNHEIKDAEEREDVLNVSEDIFFTSDRSNAEAEGTSTRIPERHDDLQVPEGRYVIHGGYGGNVEVFDSSGKLLIKDYLGSGYSPSVTVDLKEDFNVRVDGFYDLFIEPTETEMRTELTPGIWEVGLDVPSGDYGVTAEAGMGYLTIFDPEQDNQVYEIIGNEYSSTESHITLEEGQKVRVTGVQKLILNESKE